RAPHPFPTRRSSDLVLGLAAVVTARGMRIAVEGAHRAGLGIGVVAVAVEFLLAEIAAAAEDVERHQHAVADLEVLHRRTDLLYQDRKSTRLNSSHVK